MIVLLRAFKTELDLCPSTAENAVAQRESLWRSNRPPTSGRDPGQGGPGSLVLEDLCHRPQGSFGRVSITWLGSNHGRSAVVDKIQDLDQMWN